MYVAAQLRLRNDFETYCREEQVGYKTTMAALVEATGNPQVKVAVMGRCPAFISFLLSKALRCKESYGVLL